jgi:MSHA biogenesis protein MshN
MFLFQQCVITKWLEQTIQTIRLEHRSGCKRVCLRLSKSVLSGIGLFYVGCVTAQAPNLSITEVVLSQAEQVTILQQQAHQAQQDGRIQQAIKTYQRLLQLAPQSASARFELATIRVANGQWARAVKLLQDGLRQDPQQMKLTMALVQLYQSMGNDRAALQSVQAMPDTATYHVWRLEQQAVLAHRLHQHQQARTSYAALVEHQPAQGRWWLGLAIAEDRLHQLQPAMAAYERALQLEGWSLPSRQFMQNRLQALQERAPWHD